MVRRIVQACGGSVRGMTIAILGVTFKPNTDDVRDSPSLVIVPALQAEGATVRAHDPEGMETASRELPNVVWCEDMYDAMDGADAMVVLTEWNAFRGARPGARARAAAAADRGRPAQRLRTRRDDRRRLQLQQHRPAGARPDADESDEEDRVRRAGPARPAIGSIRRILREYDVRGIVGETLFAADALALGRAFATMLRAKGGQRVCVGMDGRLSSPELAEAMIEGLCASGVDVQWIGRGPTPMLYFAVHHLDADGGIQITGSHNPPAHNGFKMMLGKKSFFGAQIQELGRIAAAGRLRRAAAAGAPRRRCSTPTSTRLAQDYPGDGRELSVVWDAGNGAAGEALSALVRASAGPP